MAERYLPEANTSNTSDITMLTLFELARSHSNPAEESPLQTRRERRAFSFASPQLQTRSFRCTVECSSTRLNLEMQRQLSSPLHDAPSPDLLSPTTPSAPLSLETELESSRQRSQSCSVPSNRQSPVEFRRLILENATKNRKNPESARKAQCVAGELMKWGDDFDSTEQIGMWFRLADEGFPRRFNRVIQQIRHNLSWRTVSRLLHLGVRLLKNLTPCISSVHSQQWELFSAFLQFLREELSSWIEAQGGWDAFLQDLTEETPYSNSLPNLSVHYPHPLQPCRLETLQSRDETLEECMEDCQLVEEEDEQQATENTEEMPAVCSSPVSPPVTIPRPTTLVIPSQRRPRQLPMQSSSYPSAASSSTLSSASLVSFGIGAAFGFALYSFLSGR